MTKSKLTDSQIMNSVKCEDSAYVIFAARSQGHYDYYSKFTKFGIWTLCRQQQKKQNI